MKFFVYLLMAFLIFVDCLLIYLLPISPFVIFLSLLLIIFLPGFSLGRIFKINFSNFLDNLILSFTLGLVANLTLCLAAIFLGLRISSLTVLILIVFSLLFLIALIFDWRQPKEKSSFGKNFFSSKNIWQWQNLIYVFLLVLILMVLTTVDQLGTNFTGDPLNHLAVMRKAIENQPLTIGNLSWVKNDYHIAYGLPIWHVFLTVLTKFTHTNIFILYREIPTVLTLLVFLTWFWFLKKLLPNFYLVAFGLILAILYYFDRNAYLYTRLAVPDTLNNLMLLPLCFGLAIQYIFDRQANYKNLIILSLILALMGLIHWTQYFYYLLGIGLFLVIFIIFEFKKEDFRKTCQKIILAIFASMIFVIPLLLYLQISGGVISKSLNVLSSVTKVSGSHHFNEFAPYLQLAYLFLPLIVLFVRKYRRFLLILAVFLVGPIVYNVPFFYNLLRHYLSHVFVNRLFSNLGGWPFIIWAIIFGFVLALIDLMLIKLKKISKIILYLINFILVVFFGWMIYSQEKYATIKVFYNKIFSDDTQLWLSTHYYWLFALIIFAVLIIYILQRNHQKLTDIFQLPNFQNQSSILLITFIIIFFLAMPDQGNLRAYSQRELTSHRFLVTITDPTLQIVHPRKFGGMETIDFIRVFLPPKSVFDTSDANYDLPMLADVYMASLTFDEDPTKKYKDLYADVTIQEKLSLLKEGDIDYILYLYKKGQQQSAFDAYPEYFTRVYDNNQAAIYQVNKEKSN